MKLQLLILSILAVLTLADPRKKKHTTTSPPCTKDCTWVAASSPGTDCAKVTPLPTVGQTYCLDQSHYVVCQGGFGHQWAESVMYGDMCWTGAFTKINGPGKITSIDTPLPGQTGQEPGYRPPPTARR